MISAWISIGLITGLVAVLGTITIAAKITLTRAIQKEEASRCEVPSWLLEQADEEPCYLTEQILEAYKPYEEGLDCYSHFAVGGPLNTPFRDPQNYETYFRRLLKDDNPYEPGTQKHKAWANGFKSEKVQRQLASHGGSFSPDIVKEGDA